MSEHGNFSDPGAVWRGQAPEKVEVNVEEFVKRRTREMLSLTRTELIISLSASVGFVLIFAWRFPVIQSPVQWAGYALAVVWVAAVLYRNRGWVGRGLEGDASAAMATNCIAYYRGELVRRRDHVRTAWLWQGPLVLACLLALGPVLGTRSGLPRIHNAIPFMGVLAIWTVLNVRKRRAQAAQLQREIDEIDALRET